MSVNIKNLLLFHDLKMKAAPLFSAAFYRLCYFMSIILRVLL